MYVSDPIIGAIEVADNVEMAKIIRSGLAEYGADRPGFAWTDPQVDSLSDAYEGTNTAYWVAREPNGRLLGGCGIAPLAGLPIVGELQKMYLLPEARGRGVGRRLLEQALNFSWDHYSWCYLETLSTMADAARLYQRAGFMRLPQPLGNSGHHSCDHWYLLAAESARKVLSYEA